MKSEVRFFHTVTVDGLEVVLHGDDGTPDNFHGCYFYNGGEFPYAIKSTLDF
ncbi:MAG: hypothetical protein J6X07_02805 [Prevotella sp.]|nr:hypothetical protein [Prevotella sp.]